MIIYYRKNSWKEQIERDINELSKYKESYSNRILIYEVYLISKISSDSDSVKANKQAIEKMIGIFSEQIKILDKNINFLNEMLVKVSESKKAYLEKKMVYTYNHKYEKIKDTYINYSIIEENRIAQIIKSLIDNINTVIEEKKQVKVDVEKDKVQVSEKMIRYNIKNNDTLLISEKTGKVILPYTSEEVNQILNNEIGKYSNAEEVIEDKFIREYADYKLQFLSRYKETMKLAKEREGYSITDSIALATEMMGKRFLHPAIISACRTVDELDVYLDCLDKNELNEFKIFKVQYELYPMVAKHKIKSFDISNIGLDESEKSIQKKKNGSRFRNDLESNIWASAKKYWKKEKNKFSYKY